MNTDKHRFLQEKMELTKKDTQTEKWGQKHPGTTENLLGLRKL
jgi:hypothetical protein